MNMQCLWNAHVQCYGIEDTCNNSETEAMLMQCYGIEDTPVIKGNSETEAMPMELRTPL